MSESQNESPYNIESDRILLETSSLEIAKQISADYPVKLPDAVIFPDTSARPLATLFKPVFDKMAELRKCPPPKKMFFNVQLGYLGKNHIYPPAMINDGKIMDHDTFFQNLDRITPSEEKPTLREFAIQARLTNARRAQMILDSIRGNAGVTEPTIICIDDFSSAFGLTSRFLELAFGKPVPLYALLSNAGNEHFQKLNLPVCVGTTIDNNLGFSYKRTPGVGTTRDTFYAENLFPFKTESVTNEVNSLRKQMKLIGERVAARF